MRAMWIEAEKAVMTGQMYRIGTRQLQRADLREIGERIKYWTNEEKRLSGRSGIKVKQAIIRDT